LSTYDDQIASLLQQQQWGDDASESDGDRAGGLSPPLDDRLSSIFIRSSLLAMERDDASESRVGVGVHGSHRNVRRRDGRHLSSIVSSIRLDDDDVSYLNLLLTIGIETVTIFGAFEAHFID
jgi:hypothetical protein